MKELTAAALRKALPRDIARGEIRVFDEIDSTNEEAARRAAMGACDGSIYVADRQTLGKGRRGRTWSSPGGDDLFFSLLYRPRIPAECASMLTLVAARAMARTVEKYAGEACHIKWPNDIILHGKKMCGILTEMSAGSDGIRHLIVGIGVNLNRKHFEKELASVGTSLLIETGRRTDREAFLVDYLREFDPALRQFFREQDLAFLMEDYNQHLINVGKRVRLIDSKEEKTGIAEGINRKGELLVRNDAGITETVRSGEVSVRGLWGYV